MNVDAVAAASIDMSLAKAHVEASSGLLRKTMDFQQMTMETLISDMMPAAPSFGRMMDIRV